MKLFSQNKGRFDLRPFFFTAVLSYGCTEPLAIDITNSDSVLVVDASITDEHKYHEILLSRSSQSDIEDPIPEQSAQLKIVMEDQQEFSFSEVEPGKYVSDMAFAAQANNLYELRITSSNGKRYRSNSVELQQETQIDSVYAEFTQTDSGLQGIDIKVDSFDPTGNSTYFRYKYTETYKIIAPEWYPWELVVVNENPLAISDELHTEEKRVCFATEASNNIILTNTKNATEDRVTGFTVRFLSKDNFIISHRYSILVSQYVLSREAYEFYDRLKAFSELESIFSQAQPGFIIGNIFPEDDSNERVVGFFEVSSVSKKRIFFSYEDFFPNEPLPPFIDECKRTLVLDKSALAIAVRDQLISLAGIQNISLGEVLYYVQPRPCGDCTALGSNVVPGFWEE
ncbi:DUF4249 domain-containing protein [Flagellimonas sp.]|uniref:DUF4249 domain-containing protein n=1 Tax=Flagellimonas sp. TaxID=2058762 RepID=UPI003B5B0810